MIKKIFLISIFIIAITVLYNTYNSYSVVPKEVDMLAAIQQKVQNKKPIFFVEKSILFETDTTLLIFEQENRIGYALFKSNPLNERLKLSRVQKKIEKENQILLKTNRGLYIIFTTNIEDKIHSIEITNRNKKKYSFDVIPIGKKSEKLYITTDTIPKIIDKNMLKTMKFYIED
ncbi:MAG: hypothetical protein RR642_14825 [Solibacillus sp.]